jgi:hypothetical protein
MRDGSRGRPDAVVEPVAGVVEWFRATGRYVVSFAGFGELGYRDRRLVPRLCRELMARWDPSQVLVQCGTLTRVGGHDGIAAVYPIAKERGIMTAGIHPSVAHDFRDTHQVSPFCDRAFFVPDRSWGGFLRSGAPSPTLRAVLAVSNELIVIGGGRHAADELEAFLQRGRKARYFPAQMEPRFAAEWSRKARVEIVDPRGEALGVWERRSRHPPAVPSS